MKDILTVDQYKETEKMIHYWNTRVKNKEIGISRYDFENDMAGIHSLFDKPPQNTQNFLRDYSNEKIEYRDLFIILYGDQQKEEDIIRRWGNEE